MSRQEFEAELIADGPGGAWPRIFLSIDVPAVFGSRGRVSVKGTINGFPFQTSIFPNGDGTFHMMVNKAMREGANAKPGNVVRIVLEKDDGRREVEIPPDFQQTLEAHAEAKVRWTRMTDSARKEYADWILDAKQEATRQRRIEKALSRIAQGRRVKD